MRGRLLTAALLLYAGAGAPAGYAAARLYRQMHGRRMYELVAMAVGLFPGAFLLLSLYLPNISPVSPLHLPYISPTSPLHLPRISQQAPAEYTLPDGRVISVGPERFRLPEYLFQVRVRVRVRVSQG